MKKKSDSLIYEYIKERKKRIRLNRGCKVLAGLVAIFTLYALMLPAHTMDNTPVCGIPEHIHTEDCYQQTEGLRTLDCTAESLQLYQHGEDCYDSGGELSCGMADYVLHTHNADCYDSEGSLVCLLPEISGETHEHTEDCYTVEPDRCICGLEEDESHTHSDTCYETVRICVCGKVAVAEHVHSGPCFHETEPVKELVCGREEHTHVVTCYAGEEENHADVEIPKGTEEQSTIEQGVFSKEPHALSGPSAEERDSFAWAEIVPSEDGIIVLGCTQPQAPVGGNIEMESMIKDVEVTYIPKDTGKETPLTDDTVISEGDQIKCRIDYRVPGNVLSENNNTIIYQAPGGLKLVTIENGNVENQLGQQVGTYNIDTNGRITITFNDSYIEQNKMGSPIDGAIRFDACVNMEQPGPDGNLNLDFSSDCTIHIKVVKNTEKKGDIHLLKFAEEESDVRSKYTLYVNSLEGTFGPITVKDTMTGTVYDGGLEIVADDGSRLTVNPEPVMGAGQFEFQLPPIAAGEYYHIFYYGRPDPANTMAKVKNIAEVSTSNSLNDSIYDTASAETKLNAPTKKGVYDEVNKTITWTVIVNSARLDISGWILRDGIQKMGDSSKAETCTGKAMLTDSHGNSREIDIPYTFPSGSSDEYQISYTTPAEFYMPGTNRYSNRVTLYKGNVEQASDSADVGIGEYQVVSKKGGTPVVQGEKVIIPWTVSIDFANANIDEIFESTVHCIDSLVPMGTNHYMTGAQTEALREAGTAAFNEAGIKISLDDWQRKLSDGGFHWYYSQKDPNDKYLGFWRTIDIEKLKSATKPVTFTYTTTGTITVVDKLSQFKNEISVNQDFRHDVVTVAPD